MGRLAVACAVLAACYAPRPQAGAPCGSGDQPCPAGLVCAPETQTCERSATDAGGSREDAAPGSDVPPPPPVPDALACFGTGIVSICPTPAVTDPLVIDASQQLDTDSSPLCIAYTGTSPDGFCVIAGTVVTIDRPITASGSRPLVILATDALAINASIDVSSQRGRAPGAGANPAACVAGVPAGRLQGGPGGSFAGHGGSGGPTSSGGTPPAAGDLGDSSVLRGGCPGGNGDGQDPGEGGAGGGAVYLIATTAIAIDATVNASGAAGAGAGTLAGAGGGGSGGMIGLDAPSITLLQRGRVVANGGGGGEGATTNHGGSTGGESSSPSAAGGGAGSANKGGDGGDGSAGSMLDGIPGQQAGPCGRGDTGGGGGGGGAGVIRVAPLQALPGNKVSPPPT